MIEVEIQEWQELKAKIARLEQQIAFLKHQNHVLRTQLNSAPNHSDQPDQFIQKISISSPAKAKYSKPDIILQSEESANQSHDNSFQKKGIQYLSLSRQNNLCSSRNQQETYNNGHSSVDLQNSQNSPSKQDINSIKVSRKSHKEIQLKKLISSSKGSVHQIKDELHLIEEICVFGPSLSQENLRNVTFKYDQKQLVEPALYYPHNSSGYQHYGNYLFPKKCRIKPTQKSHMVMEGNKIIFKSSKKPDCNIFIFQANQKLHPIKKPHEMLDSVNPSKWLYGIVIDFNDFVFQEIKQKEPLRKGASEEELDEMYEMQSPTISRDNRKSLLELDVRGFLEQQIRMESVSLKDIELDKEKVRMYRSTFSLCIFTYFPFVTYLQRIISAMFDEVKLKRIQHFPQTGELKDCDIFYVIQEVDRIAKHIRSYFHSRPVRIGKELSLGVNQTELFIDLSKQQLQRELYCDWASRVIKMMEKETFYEIYCMVMLEESVTFVCQDKTLLTFIILLFASMLTKPFMYPYPVVSVLFTEELLQTPFTSIVGINQSLEWLQDAIRQKMIDSETKQIIMVTDKEVKIRKSGNFSAPKSQRLKRIFSKFYKKTEPSSLSAILLRKDSLLKKEPLIRRDSLPMSQAEIKQSSEHVLNFFAKLQIFYHENIFAFMPHNLKVERRKKEADEENKVTMRNELLNQIQRQYKASNPNYCKDEFIREFIKTQIFSIYLIEEYQLDS